MLRLLPVGWAWRDAGWQPAIQQTEPSALRGHRRRSVGGRENLSAMVAEAATDLVARSTDTPSPTPMEWNREAGAGPLRNLQEGARRYRLHADTMSLKSSHRS